MARIAGIDLTGRTFGELVVLERGPGLLRRGGGHEAQWLTVCTCGRERMVRAGRLLTGTTTTCGTHRSPRAPESSYTAAHQRIRAARGPASHYRCAVCADRGDQWALSVTEGPQVHQTPGGYFYSLDVDLYVPMCHRCHEHADALERRRRRGEAAGTAGLPLELAPLRLDEHRPPPAPAGRVLAGTLF